MKIVIAPDSFKDCLSAAEVCQAVEEGMRRVLPHAEYLCLPVADGGEGITAAIASAKPGRFHTLSVSGPLAQNHNAQIFVFEQSSVIETASACGLELLSLEQRKPMLTTSFGVGQLILKALDLGLESIILGLGGSATSDGGAGMMAALGAKFFDVQGRPIIPTGGTLRDVAGIDVSGLDQRLSRCELILAADVNNPLCGENGAAKVFAPQKGANQDEVEQLADGLEHWAWLLQRAGGRDVSRLAGAGAAGGMASGLMSLLACEAHSGIDVVLDAVDFNEKVTGASMVITGEGRVDSQTIFGKTPIGVAKRAPNCPVILLCGATGAGFESVYDAGIDAVYSASSGDVDLAEAIAQAPENLANIAESVARSL